MESTAEATVTALVQALLAPMLIRCARLDLMMCRGRSRNFDANGPRPCLYRVRAHARHTQEDAALSRTQATRNMALVVLLMLAAYLLLYLTR